MLEVIQERLRMQKFLADCCSLMQTINTSFRLPYVSPGAGKDPVLQLLLLIPCSSTTSTTVVVVLY
jgi:hypothetical protein